VRSIYREAIGVVRGRERVPKSERKRAYRRELQRMAAWLRIEWKDPDAVRIAKDLRRRKGMLFTLLRTPGVPCVNGAGRSASFGAEDLATSL
ncbi:MAG: hypothetical protein ACREB9_04105, partial [Thermoplasmata archaeon]